MTATIEELATPLRTDFNWKRPDSFLSDDETKTSYDNHFLGHDDSSYRLNVLPLRVPPLREPSEDIPLLVRHFVDRYAQRMTRRAEQLAVTEERNRLAREIHDTLAQAFAGIVLHSEALGTALGVNKRRTAKALSQIQKLARSGLEEARRSVQALRPKALEGSTISQALKQAAKRFAEGGKLSCQFRQRGEARMLSLEAQNELFRIAQEALTNVDKHAKAKSVWVTLTFTARQVALTIQDDGVGLIATTSVERKRGYGLSTMRERAQRIGGQLDLETPKKGGTSIRVRVPLANADKSVNPRCTNETAKN